LEGRIGARRGRIEEGPERRKNSGKNRAQRAFFFEQADDQVNRGKLSPMDDPACGAKVGLQTRPARIDQA